MRGSAAFRTGVAPGGALAGPWVRDPLWRTARAVPSLDLDFAGNKSLIDRVTSQNLVSFTRASSGTYVGSDGLIKTAATNEPRFDHNPTTGESLGLLVEEARTNLVQRSEEFGTTWTATRTSVSTDATLAPSGATTADKLVEDTTATNTHQIQQTVTLVANTTYTTSFYIKSGERTELRFLFSAGSDGINAAFNLSTGVATAQANTGSGVIASATLTPVGNGWFRATAIGLISPTSTSGVLTLRLLSSGSNSYTGDGTSGLFLWGAQLEAGAFPTSYIPTTTATVTRAADVASITGSNFSSWYDQTESTLFVDGSTPAFTATTGFVAINAGASTNRLDMRQSRGQPTVNGATTAVSWGSIVAAPTLVANTSYKQAVAVSNASHGNSTAGSLDTSSTAIGTIAATQLIFGMRDNQTAPVSGSSSTIRRLTYWPTRLANTTLQAISQP
jgi:hypothetical protein